MAAAKRIPSKEIREFIVRNVEEHQNDIAKTVMDRFGISRQAANSHLRKLVSEEVLKAGGRTKGRTYALEVLTGKSYEISVTPDLEEDVEWRENILPLLKDLPESVKDICQYGFTEMLNNVVSHSNAEKCEISVEQTAKGVLLVVHDNGVGIFRKIQNELGLDDAHHAILELSKGKLTTAPEEHSGEGIFFTSRAFDDFGIVSDGLLFLSKKEGEDWLLDVEDSDATEGTKVYMEISQFAEQTLRQVFRRYEDDEARFSRTHVAIKLAKYEGEKLVSRSQARRLLARTDRFKELILDFEGVDEIGQAFADEIFRVFKRASPKLKMFVLNTSPAIERMIAHVLNAQPDPQISFEFD